jgi:hypothetical protein
MFSFGGVNGFALPQPAARPARTPATKNSLLDVSGFIAFI